jgi:hypothetical protein
MISACKGGSARSITGELLQLRHMTRPCSPQR